jgi:hypothetical protein
MEMAEIKLTDSEQREILRNPVALALLMDYHDIQQDQADSMGAECHGDELRREELRKHGAAIIVTDPEAWPEDLRKQFAEPTGYAAQRLARAQAASSSEGNPHA